jgi:hypothetical protein
MNCKRCGSFAINPEHHGRIPNIDLDLCDVCYWRKQAEAQTAVQTEFLDCIHNLMGIFDTPMARRYINSDFAEEARQIGRDILNKTNRESWQHKDELYDAMKTNLISTVKAHIKTNGSQKTS